MATLSTGGSERQGAVGVADIKHASVETKTIPTQMHQNTGLDAGGSDCPSTNISVRTVAATVVASPRSLCFGHLGPGRIGGCALLIWVGSMLFGWSTTPLTRALMSETRAPEAVTNAATGGLDAAAVKLVEEKLAKARTDLAAATTFDGLSVTNRPDGLSLQDAALRRGLLERLVRLYEQQLSFMAELETVKGRRADLAHEAQSWTGFTEPRPYSILLTDKLNEGIQVERLGITSGESALTMLAKLMAEQQELLKQAEERIRLLNEKLEAGRDTQAANELIWTREMERLRSQVAGATIAVFDLERRIRQERLAGSRIRLGLLQQQFVIANAGATFHEVSKSG